MFFHKSFDRTMQQVKTDLETKPIILLDVRRDDEYQEGHLPQAVHIPLDCLEATATSKLDQNACIYVYCRSGQRAMSAKRMLVDLGFRDASNIGGIVQWPYEIEKE